MTDDLTAAIERIREGRKWFDLLDRWIELLAERGDTRAVAVIEGDTDRNEVQRDLDTVLAAAERAEALTAALKHADGMAEAAALMKQAMLIPDEDSADEMNRGTHDLLVHHDHYRRVRAALGDTGEHR